MAVVDEASIPDFVTYPEVQFPVLPQGIHEATVGQVEERLVEAFSPSDQRRRVFDGWIAFRTIVRSLIAVEAEYIDGSFVSEKPEPKDIDVSFWIKADSLNAVDQPTGLALNDLFSKASSYFMDVYVVPECDDQTHPSWSAFNGMLWTDHFWTRCRDSNGLLLPAHGPRKGYLRVTP